MVRKHGLDWRIDSAGTGAWHAGNPPDPRMIEAAANRGIDLTPLRARQAEPDDFLHFDHIFAMDRSNLADLTAMQPHNGRARLSLFLAEGEIPDPYYGGPDGFERVLDLIEARMEILFRTLGAA